MILAPVTGTVYYLVIGDSTIMEQFQPRNRALNANGGIEKSLVSNAVHFIQTITTVEMQKGRLNVAHGVTYRNGQ